MSGALAALGGVPDLSRMHNAYLSRSKGNDMLRNYLQSCLDKLDRGELWIESFTLDQSTGYSKGVFTERGEISGRPCIHTIEVKS